MFGQSKAVYFTAFLALLAPALADVYRVDDRSPEKILEDKGFKARNPDGDGSVIEHVQKKLGDDDPWVSTTSDYEYAKGKDRITNPIFRRSLIIPLSFAASVKSNLDAYIYYISSNGIKLVETKKEFEDAKIEHPHPGEFEFSVKGEIEWDSIIKWEHWVRGELKETVTRDDFEEENDDKKRSVPLVRSVKFRV